MTTPAEAPVTLRPAAASDLESIENFIAPYMAGKVILPRTAEELGQLIPTGFVAECEGRIVGFATLEIYSRKLAEIRSLCVDTSLRGRGIGRKLIDRCLELARERSVFEVMAITSAEDFFRSCGFDFTLPGEKKALFLQTRDEH